MNTEIKFITDVNIHKNIILFLKENNYEVDWRIESLKELLDLNSNKIYGYFTVITENKIRINKL